MTEFTEFRKKPKRRIMRRFSLTEISAVDNPAQKGATVSIFKRSAEGIPIHEHEDTPMNNIDRDFDHDEDLARYEKDSRDNAATDFRSLVAALQKEEGLSGTDAMRKARRVDPLGFAKMQGEPQPVSFGFEDEAYRKLAAMEFEDLTIEIMARDDCPRTEAMAKCRVERPDVFAEFSGYEPVTKTVSDWDHAVAAEQERSSCTAAEAARAVYKAEPSLALVKVEDNPNEDRMDGEQAKRRWLIAVEETRKANPGMNTTGVLQKTRKLFPSEFAEYQSIGGKFDNPRPWSGERKD